MKLKGKTTIELTDVNTGVVEVVEEENMITSALHYFFNSNFMGVFNHFNNTSSIKGYDNFLLPICPNLIGGLFLFNEPLDEDPENLLPNCSQMPMAYASNNTNPYEDTKRGSMNLTETMAITNGYKYVWDFATSQGNGTIAALALTNSYGGAAVYGSAYEDATPFMLIKRDSITGLSSSMRVHFMEVVEMDVENEIVYSIQYATTGVTIYKIHLPMHQVGLLENIDGVNCEIIEQHTIVPSTFKFVENIYPQGTFLDGMDGYWYGFGNKENSSGSANLYWIKINKEDYSFTEGKWTLSGVYLNAVGIVRESTPYLESKACIRNGYLYVMSYNRKQVYKLNLENPTDVTKLSLGITSNSYGLGEISNDARSMILLEDVIIGRDFLILADDTIVLTKGDEKIEKISSPALQWKQYFVVWTGSHRNIYLLTPFFATINNLETAVVKTADKTMKITYTLTQET